jgi:anti-sigma factor RsiW
MTVSSNHQHSDWERQYERLSAYLDNEVDEDERAALERHLPTCEECRDTLEELRQTRALLRALPAPVSPRSFLIPETGAVPQSITLRAAGGTSPRQHVQRARALQWVGGLVAAVGLFIVISSTLPASMHNLSQGASSSSSAEQSSAKSSLQPSSTAVETQRPSSTIGEGGSTAHVPTRATQPAVEPTATKAKGQPTAGTGSAIPLWPISGVLLLIGGVSLLLVGTLFLRRL